MVRKRGKPHIVYRRGMWEAHGAASGRTTQRRFSQAWLWCIRQNNKS